MMSSDSRAAGRLMLYVLHKDRDRVHPDCPGMGCAL